jgi:hypothetical protein
LTASDMLSSLELSNALGTSCGTDIVLSIFLAAPTMRHQQCHLGVKYMPNVLDLEGMRQARLDKDGKV